MRAQLKLEKHASALTSEVCARRLQTTASLGAPRTFDTRAPRSSCVSASTQELRVSHRMPASRLHELEVKAGCGGSSGDSETMRLHYAVVRCVTT